MNTPHKISLGGMVGIAAGVLLLVGIAVIVALMPGRKEGGALPPVSEAMPREALPQPREAAIWLSVPEEATVRAGEESKVEIWLDTKGQGVSAVRAVVAYDPVALEVLSVEGSGSAFPMEAVPPDALTPGRAEVVRFIVDTEHQEGYRGFAGTGLFATLRIIPRRAGPHTLSLSPSETQYSPYGAALEVSFTDVGNGEFVVQ